MRGRQIEPEKYTLELRSAFELLIDSDHKPTVRKAGTAVFKEIRKLLPNHHARDIAREAIFVARELCPVDDPALAQARDGHIRREITAAHMSDLPAARRNKIMTDARKRWES